MVHTAISRTSTLSACDSSVSSHLASDNTSTISPSPSATSLSTSSSLSSITADSEGSSLDAIDAENLDWDTNGINGTLRARCPRCGQWIGTGSKKPNIAPVKTHMASQKKCRPASLEGIAMSDARAARHALLPLPPTRSHAGTVVCAPSTPPPSRLLEDLAIEILTPSKFTDEVYATDDSDSGTHTDVDSSQKYICL
ncbi:hypothetical protein BV20DRAFT_963223 [Pilatotrama ljubarskyi]|nr:hypothetical protein BV20DRAFT_963223 [Pilatotrama ljubarskyi]